MTNILVTGGAGYIGSHTCKALFKAGFTPITYDNLAMGHQQSVQWGPFERGDLTDQPRLNQVFKQYQPTAVLHFAAYAYVGESIIYPAKYYQNNVIGTLNLLETMLKNDVRSLVFSSTCATYGIPDSLPITENTRQCPINPYGHSKLMIEQILKDYDRAYDIRSISLRYFNAAGADPDGEIGENHDPETHLIPLILQAAAGIHPDFTIFGKDYNTQDGTCIRDYIHVADLADAHVLALKYLETHQKTNFFNLGNGTGHSVQEIIDTATTVTNKSITVKIGARRPGDPDCLVAHAEKALTELNWNPRYPQIEAIIDSAWKWLCKSQV